MIDKRVRPNERQQWPDLQILKQTSKQLDSLTWQRESVLTGAGIDGRMLAKFHKCDISCLCDEANPTRRHLTWYCDSSANTRSALFAQSEMPARDSAAEGLLVLSSPFTFQIEPSAILQHGLQCFTPQVQFDLLTTIEQALQTRQGSLCIVGTDGGSHRCKSYTRGSWAVANSHFAVGGKMQGFDQAHMRVKSILYLLQFWQLNNLCTRCLTML